MNVPHEHDDHSGSLYYFLGVDSKAGKAFLSVFGILFAVFIAAPAIWSAFIHWW